MTAELQQQTRQWVLPLRQSEKTSKGHARASAALKEYLDDVAPLDSRAQMRVREKVLKALKAIVDDWVKETLLKKNVPEDEMSGGKLFISGSYRLGVCQKGADIDTICAVPRLVEHSDFFDEEEGMVARLRKQHGVSHVLPIAGAAVPMIEVVWNEIDLDVLFARVQREKVPATPADLQSLFLFRGGSP